MDKEVKKQFPWISNLYGKFAETVLSGCGIETLEELEWNIAQEIEKLEQKFSSRRAKLLLDGLEWFYFYFCRMCSFNYKDFPDFMSLSSEMKNTWSYILSSFLKLCLLLSRGKISSKWINKALKEIARFPGEQYVLYDALLLVQRLNRKFTNAYGAILQNHLLDMTSSLPVILDDPAEFLKVYLLVRRLRQRTKCAAEKVHLLSRFSQVLAPPSLWDWLRNHDFNVPWTRRGIKKVHLGMNLCRKLGGSQEIVKALRQILLPGLCTKRKAEQHRPCTDQILFEDNQEEITLNENKVKKGKLKKRRINTQEDEEVTSLNRPEIQQPTGISEEIVGSDENVSCNINHTWAISTFDSDKLVSEKKSKKKCKSVQSEERLNSESVGLDTKTDKKQRKEKLKKIARKVLNEADQSADKDSSVLKDKKGIVGRRKWPEMDNEDEDCAGNFGYESEPKSKKRRQKEKIVVKKDPDNGNVTSFVLEDISQTAKITERKQLVSNSADKNESDVGDSPSIVEEIYVNNLVPNERVTPKKEDSDSNDDRPVILKQVEHSQDSDLDSSYRQKSKDTIRELKSNPGPEYEILAESIFIIDSKPDPCFSESETNQIAFDTIYDADQRSASVNISLPESTNLENINNCNIKIKTESELESLELHSSLVVNSDDSAQKVEKQEDEHPSVKAGELFSVKNEVIVSDTNHIDTSIAENNVKVIVKSELPLQNSVLSCDVKRQEPFQETKVFESSIDSALSNTSSQKTGEISPQNLIATVRSESVNITSPESTNLEKINNNCNIKIKTESQPESLEVHGSLVVNRDDSAQKVEKQKDEHPSIKTGELFSVKNEVIVSETNHIDTAITATASFDSVDVSSERMIVEINNNCSIKVKSELQQGILNSDSNLRDRMISEAVSDSEGNSSFTFDNLEVKKEKDDSSIDMHRPSENNSTDDQPKCQVAGLFFDAKSPISRIKEGLHKDSEGSPNHQILDGIMTPNSDDKVNSNQAETPNTSAARRMIENVLTLAESTDCHKKSIKQIINKGDLTSILDSVSIKHLPKLTSLAVNEKPVESVSFLDISAQNGGSFNESRSFSCHTRKISEFLQYRDLPSDEDDNRSEDAPSESRSASDVNNESESESKSFKDYNSPVSSCEEDYEHDTSCSQSNKRDVSTSTMPVNIRNLNPLVDLGVRCDSKHFIDRFSAVSSDSISIPTNSSLLLDIKVENEEINETRPFNPNEASSTVNQLFTPVNEIERKLDSIQQSISDTENHGEIDAVNIDIKTEVPTQRDDVKEICLIPDQKSTISDEDGEAEETTKTRKEIDLSLCMKLRKRLLTAVQTEEPMPDDEGSKGLNEDTTHCMNLRSRHSSSASSEGKSASPDKGSSVLNQDILEINCMALRNQSPSPPSSQEKIAPANEDSNVLNQDDDEGSRQLNEDIPATHRMTLRSRHSSSASSEGKSPSANKDPSVLNRDILETNCKALKNRSPSSPSSQEKMVLANEDSNVLNQGDEGSKGLNEVTTHCMTLRSRHSSSASSEGKSASGDENSSVLNQDILVTNCKALRNRSLSSPSSQEKMVLANEDSNVLNQGDDGVRRLNEDIPATHCMTLRSRHSSSASSEGKSASTDQDSSVLNQDILVTDCMALRNRSPSSPSGQEKMAPTNEDSNVLNQDAPVIQYMNLRCRSSTMSSNQEKSALVNEVFSVLNQHTPATCHRNLRNKNPSTSPIQQDKKRRSQTITKRSSKRLKKEVNLNLGFHFSELSLNSPKAPRSKLNDSSNKTSYEVMKESSTCDQENPSRKSTRASVISSTGGNKLKKKDIPPEGYNLRSRKSVIMPGKLKL